MMYPYYYYKMPLRDTQNRHSAKNGKLTTNNEEFILWEVSSDVPESCASINAQWVGRWGEGR